MRVSLLLVCHFCTHPSDVEDCKEDNALDISEGMEQWPPSHYSSSEPLALPFGPRTSTMRGRLANVVSFKHVAGSSSRCVPPVVYRKVVLYL
jgi:hypothetical protein